jgi:hypothetical protein
MRSKMTVTKCVPEVAASRNERPRSHFQRKTFKRNVLAELGAEAEFERAIISLDRVTARRKWQYVAIIV